MNQFSTCVAIVISFFLYLFPGLSISQQTHSIPSNYHQPLTIPLYQQSNQVIKKILKNPGAKSDNMSQRISTDSQFFLGKPYFLGALGEGEKGKFDQDPLYRIDAFDCVTLVSTVLALAESTNLKQFQNNIVKIRYRNADVSYLHRNHFMTVDWNKNNTRNGFLEDLTYKIVNRQGYPIAEIANTVINKPGWYRKLTVENIKLRSPLSKPRRKQLLNDLHQLAKQTQQEKAVLLYLPLSKLYSKSGKPNMFLFNQISSGSIIEIVRPNWQLQKIIGTSMNVSHLGFGIRTKKGLMYREASSLEHNVVDIPLTKYLKHYFLKSKTVKGIHVMKVVFPNRKSTHF